MCTQTLGLLPVPPMTAWPSIAPSVSSLMIRSSARSIIMMRRNAGKRLWNLCHGIRIIIYSFTSTRYKSWFLNQGCYGRLIQDPRQPYHLAPSCWRWSIKQLKRYGTSTRILLNFDWWAMGSILMGCNPFGNWSALNHWNLQRALNRAQSSMGSSILYIQSIFLAQCIRKAGSVIKDACHPVYFLFTLLGHDVKA